MYEFFIAGRTRNRDKILELCALFDQLNISYFCFLKEARQTHLNAGLNLDDDPEKVMKKFEDMELQSHEVRTIFERDMEAQRKSKNFLLVLPSGTSGHIEAGVAYGLGQKCYAIGDYDATDSLYLIFEEIFADKKDLTRFLKNLHY